MTITLRFFPNDKGSPAGKLADVELHYADADAGILQGLKLIGFAVWERRNGGRNLTFPARQYSVNGERRSFALLRPTTNVDPITAQDRLRDAVLAAYAEYEQAQADGRDHYRIRILTNGTVDADYRVAEAVPA